MHPGLPIALALVGGLIWWGLKGWERLVHNHRRRDDAIVDPGVRSGGFARPATMPDRPLPLPRDTGWLWVPAEDPEVVAKVLSLRTVLPSNWHSGVAAANGRHGAFASPPLDGHVLVIGADVAALAGDLERLEALLVALGDTFGAAAWFVTDDRGGTHGWAVAHRGVLRRGYLYTEEHGHVWSYGEPTPDEEALGCFVDDPRDSSDDDVKWWPDRATVLRLAARWSFDPAALAATDWAVDTGLLGRL